MALEGRQEKIDAIDNAGRELVRLDAEQISRLNTEERLALLEQKIIRFTRELMRVTATIDRFVVMQDSRKHVTQFL